MAGGELLEEDKFLAEVNLDDLEESSGEIRHTGSLQ